MKKYEDNVIGRVSGNVMQALGGLSVVVTVKATGATATLFADDEVTQLVQPLRTDDNGYFRFKAVDGEYVATFSGRNIATFARELVLDDPLAQLAASTGAAQVGFIQSGAGAVARTASDKLRDTVSVKDFGAVGDGVTDDTAAIQAAISASYGKKLFVPDGTYKMLSSVIVTQGITIEMAAGAVLDYSQAAAGAALSQKYAIGVTGTQGATVAATADVTVGATTLQLTSTATFSANNWIILQSDQEFTDGASGTGNKRGHIARIKSIDSATQVTLWEKSDFAYVVASNARISKLTPVEKFTLTGGAMRGGGVGKVHSGVKALNVLNARIDGVTLSGFEDSAVIMDNSIDSAVHGCHIYDATSPGGAIGNTGYGVVMYGGRGLVIDANSFQNCRHAVAGGGASVMPVGCTVTGNIVSHCGIATAALDCHEPCWNWSFIGNIITGGASGAVLRGRHVTFSDNVIDSMTGTGIMRMQYENDTSNVAGAIITGNTIRNCVVGIEVRGKNIGTEMVAGVLLSNNTFIGNSGHAIQCRDAVGLIINNNRITEIAGSGRYGIYLLRCTSVTCNGNNIDASLATNLYPIGVENCSKVAISGSILTGSASAASQDGIRIYAVCTSIIVTNNVIGGCSRYAVYASDTDRIIVSLNDVRDAVSATKILISGATTSVNVNNIS